MAELTDLDRLWIRERVGPQPPDGSLDDLYEALGDRTAVALSILRTRRATIASSPMSVSLAGDASVNWAGNVKAIDDLIANMEAGLGEGDVSDTLGTALLVRDESGWSR